MKLRIVALAGIAEADVERWSRLRSRAINPYPGLDPRVMLPASRTRDDAAGTRLLFLEDDDQLLLVMAFVVESRVERFPLRVVTTRDPFLVNESAWHFPWVDSARAVEAFEGLFAGLKTLGLPGLVEFSQFPGDGPLWDALAEASERAGAPRLLRDRIEFAWVRDAVATAGDGAKPSGEGPFLPSFVVRHSSSQTRRRARQVRALEEHLGERLRIEDRAGDPAALDRFMDLQASGWKGDTSRGGKGLRVTHFDRWFSEVASNFREDGDLFLQALVGGDDVIYMRACLRVEGGVFGYADAYDERFAAYGPGTLGRIACMNLILPHQGVQFFDPNMDARYVDSSKLYPDRRPHSKVLVAPGGAVARAVVRALPVAKNFRDRVRGNGGGHA